MYSSAQDGKDSIHKLDLSDPYQYPWNDPYNDKDAGDIFVAEEVEDKCRYEGKTGKEFHECPNRS